MKKAVVLLAVLSVALVAALLINRKNVGNQIQHAQARLDSISNRVADIEMKLNHQERINLSLSSNLSNRVAELAKSASELARVRTSLAQSQAETRAAQAQFQNEVSRIQAAQSQLPGLSDRIEELTVLVRQRDDEIARTKALLASAEARSQELTHQSGALQHENDRMARQLRDPELLRAQIAALKEQEAAIARSRKSGSASPDYRLDLELLSDGNVRFAAPTNAPMKF